MQMKYTVEGFNQAKLVEMKLDATDALILRWYVDFLPKMSIIISNSTRYAWVNYTAVINDLPCIGITNNQVIARRFDKFVNAKIMEKHVEKKRGNFTCFRLTEKYLQLIDTTTLKSIPVDKKVKPPINPKVETKDYSIIKDSSIKIIKHWESKSSIILKNNTQNYQDIIENISNILKNYTIEECIQVIDYIFSSNWHVTNGQTSLMTIFRIQNFAEKLDKATNSTNILNTNEQIRHALNAPRHEQNNKFSQQNISLDKIPF